MDVHPELAPTFERLPARPLDPYADVAALRRDFRRLMALADGGTDPRVDVQTIEIGGPDANTICTHVVKPRRLEPPAPAIIYIHGGGFAYGELDGPSRMARDAAVSAGAVVLNPHYRLAPEHRFPAGIEDCYRTLEWVHQHAHDLGTDPARIAVAGPSAGACLSAALCLMARDRSGPRIMFQCLLIPVLDDRSESESRRSILDRRIINGPGVDRTWDNYLGRDRDPATTSPYAAPARAANLRRLPPAFIQTCGLDPLRDDGIAYANRLAKAEVPVSTNHVPGAWHFFEAYAPDSRLARAATAAWLHALATALKA